MKGLFKTIKAAAGGRGLGRVFITGVSPVAMNSLTSAYDVSKNIYLQARCNALCGFREPEIATMVARIAEEHELPQSQVDETLSMIRTFYKGYRFSHRAEEQVYNPTLALYFLEEFQRECRYPNEVLDINLAIDHRDKMHYIARLPEGRQLIFNALAKEKPVHIRRLTDLFGVENMLHAPKDIGFVASLLYYFGILTLGGITPIGELILTIPNLAIRKLYAEQIQEMLLPNGRVGDPARRATQGNRLHHLNRASDRASIEDSLSVALSRHPMALPGRRGPVPTRWIRNPCAIS